MRARFLGLASFICGGYLLASCSDDPNAGAPPPDGSVSRGATANSQGGESNGTGGAGSSKGGSGSRAGASNSTGGTGNGTGGGGSDDLFAHCELPWSGDPPPVGDVECDLDALEDGGPLPNVIDANLTLDSGMFYQLSGYTVVRPGVTLAIPPCVKILGQSPQSVLATLAMNEDGSGAGNPGRLVADGEPMAPIIFTSAQPPGDRLPGDWGGILILGNAHENSAPGDAFEQRPTIEGLEGLVRYGRKSATYDDESSGSLSYVRVEYASRQIVLDSETNGLTFAGVGSGTSVHHVMVSNSNDDCFEWFGGSVNAHHLIALNCDDDMFDTDRGFTGTIQFAFGRQFPTTTEPDSSGFEMDGGPNDTVVPLTAAQWSNVTICGTNNFSQQTRPGMVMRKNLGGSFTNTLVTGFALGLSVRGNTDVAMTNSSFFGNGQTYDTPHDQGPDWLSSQEGNSEEAPDRFCDCWANPPRAVAAGEIEGGSSAGFPDDDAAYQGAFRDASPESNWMTGLWVDWSDN